MSRNDEFGESLGINKREQNEIQGKAIADHLWQGVEGIFGNIKVQNQSNAYDRLRERFPTHEIHQDEGDWPYVEEKHGAWRARYFNGPNIEIVHRRHGAQDALDIGDEHKTLGEDGLKQHLRDWHREYGRDYEQHLNNNRLI